MAYDTNLSSLPQTIGKLKVLEELYAPFTVANTHARPRVLVMLDRREVQRTQIESLPEAIGDCISLRILCVLAPFQPSLGAYPGLVIRRSYMLVYDLLITSFCCTEMRVARKSPLFQIRLGT